MFLQLTTKTAFWSLVDQDTRQLIAHLTFLKPGPVEVDYDNLETSLKKVVDDGLAYGSIIRTDQPEEELKCTCEGADQCNECDNGKDPEEVEAAKKGIEDTRVEKQLLTIDQMLDQGVRGVRDQLRTGLYSAEYITRTVETEKAGKNRQTVIKALEQKINKIGGTGAVIESDETEEIEINIDSSFDN